ncbi:unnamed protein product, partial [marine sediment metagenome]
MNRIEIIDLARNYKIIEESFTVLVASCVDMGGLKDLQKVLKIHEVNVKSKIKKWKIDDIYKVKHLVCPNNSTVISKYKHLYDNFSNLVVKSPFKPSFIQEIMGISPSILRNRRS